MKEEAMKEKTSDLIAEDADEFGFSWLVAVFVIFVNVFITVGLLYAYDVWYAEKVVTVDIDSKIRDLRRDFVKREINEKELADRLNVLKAGIGNIAKRNVILRREAIIAGGQDVTNKLE